jgi:DNA repair exonuclease SbcCD ATPase subunit
MVDDIRGQLSANEALLQDAMGKLDDVASTVAAQFQVSEGSVGEIIQSMTPEDARSVPTRLATAVSRMAGLRAQQSKVERDRERGAERAVERARAMQALREAQAIEARRLSAEIESVRSSVAVADQELKTYARLIAKEEGSLEAMGTQHADLDAKIQRLQEDSGVFAFWDLAFSRRASGASSSTFRGFVLDRCLDDLNSIFAQIITVLYEDTRHAKAMTTGILKSLFDSDETPSILDRSARVSASLGYAKRSGGERKRIDLALFFALVQLSQARSAHRSRYIFVDEVFDSLDEAGQRAVVRWCDWMAQRLGWVLVVTHSQLLVGMGEGEEGGHRVRVSMGDAGTELDLGRDRPEDSEEE